MNKIGILNMTNLSSFQLRQLYLERDFTNSYVVYNVSSLSITYPFVSIKNS